MKEIGESASSDDVGAFLRSELPELAAKRREIVNKAVDEARDRPRPSGQTPVAEPDVAFAPTIMSQASPPTAREGRADRSSDVGTLALTRRKAPSNPLAVPGEAEALDQEPIEIPKTSKAWLWLTLVVLAVGGGAAYHWPAEAKGILAKIGIGGGPDESALHAVPVPSDSSVPTAVAPSARPVPPPSTAPSSPEPTSEPSASAPAAQLGSAASSAAHPEPGGSHHTWPVPGLPPVPPHPEPGASAAPTATSTWSPYKPQPTSSENPYENGSPP
jgi:hypothetical protein